MYCGASSGRNTVLLGSIQRVFKGWYKQGQGMIAVSQCVPRNTDKVHAGIGTVFVCGCYVPQETRISVWDQATDTVLKLHWKQPHEGLHMAWDDCCFSGWNERSTSLVLLFAIVWSRIVEEVRFWLFVPNCSACCNSCLGHQSGFSRVETSLTKLLSWQGCINVPQNWGFLNVLWSGDLKSSVLVLPM